MKYVRQTIIWLIVLVVCTGIIFFAGKKKPVIRRMSDTSLATTVDAVAINVAFQEFDQNGTQVHAFSSKCMRHIQKNNTHVFTQPRIQIISTEQPPMNLSADSAISLHSGKTITFKDNVHLNTIASAKRPDMHVTTKSLKYNSQKQQVTTSDQVFFTQAPTQGHSHGMTADLATHSLRLLNDVVVDQPSAHLRAHNVTTHGDSQHPLLTAIINGESNKPAHYWSKLKPDEPLMHARADHMLLNQITQTILLTGTARITQGPQSFTAPRIIYDLAHRHVITTPTTLARTTIVIYPEKNT